MKVTFNLGPEQAAGLKRFAEKISHDQAASVLYAHVKVDIREEQTHAILSGFAELERALDDAGARSWPWIDSGRAGNG